MFDIFLKNGKKESFIKLKDGKIEGYNLLNGTISNITEEELEIVNSIKMGNDATYIGKENNYDAYLDNHSGLKHYFLNGVESIEMFIKYNTEDALLYKREEYENKSLVEIFKIRLKKYGFMVIRQSALGVIMALGVLKAQDIYVSYQEKNVEPIAYEDINDYFEENDKLEEVDKELLNNKKLLSDIIPYYNGTNMDYIARTRFDNLRYHYFEGKDDRLGYYNSSFPDVLNIKEGLELKKDYDTKCHEYIHLLQSNYEYKYLKEACAEIISYEYYDDCLIDAYEESVKNTKILMETIGPEPIWKLNFSGDDTELVKIINENLSAEKAEQLIRLLKEKPYAKENLDKEIRILLEELYYNMYSQSMNENIYIQYIKNNMLMNRYYFNSEKILENNPCYLEGKNVYEISKELTYEEYREYLNEREYADFAPKIVKVWIDESLNGTMPMEEAIQNGQLTIYYEERKALSDVEKKELRDKGYSCVYYGTLAITPEIMEFFLKVGNASFNQSQLNEKYEVIDLPNIYETFPNATINVNNQKK